MENQDRFTGNREDLDAFLALARSPIRTEDRTRAQDAWRRYKQATLLTRYRRRFLKDGDGPSVVDKGWNIRAIEERLIDLSGINLDGAILGFVDLRGVRLDGASLRGAWLKNAEMEHASLRDVHFEPPEGAEVPGFSRLLNADLSHADLTGADLSHADLSGATFFGATLAGARLRMADLSRASLVGADLAGADMRGSRVHGVSVWDVRLCEQEHLRHDLVVTPEGEAELRVDDIEVAQFVYLLLNRRKLRTVINAVTRKGVLILGRFRDGGLAVLQSVAARLRELGYLPLLFDTDGPEDRDLTETILTMASLSRFVIADLSGPSVLKELEAIAPNLSLPVIPILEDGRRPPSMFKDLLKFDWVSADILSFRSPEALVAALEQRVIRPAEAMRGGRERRTPTVKPIG